MSDPPPTPGASSDPASPSKKSIAKRVNSAMRRTSSTFSISMPGRQARKGTEAQSRSPSRARSNTRGSNTTTPAQTPGVEEFASSPFGVPPGERKERRPSESGQGQGRQEVRAMTVPETRPSVSSALSQSVMNADSPAPVAEPALAPEPGAEFEPQEGGEGGEERERRGRFLDERRVTEEPESIVPASPGPVQAPQQKEKERGYTQSSAVEQPNPWDDDGAVGKGMPEPEPAMRMPEPQPAPAPPTMPVPQPALAPAVSSTPSTSMSEETTPRPGAFPQLQPEAPSPPETPPRGEGELGARPSKSSLVGHSSVESRDTASTTYGDAAVSRFGGGRVSKQSSAGSLAGSLEAFRPERVGRVVVVTNKGAEGEGRDRGRGPVVEVIEEDPFVDPQPQPQAGGLVAHRKTVDVMSPVESIPDAEQSAQARDAETGQGKGYDATPTPVSYPLPPSRDVMGSHVAPSKYSLGPASSNAAPSDYDTDERRPLLREEDKDKDKSKRTPHFFRSGGKSTSPSSPPFSKLGWTEIVLPDSAVYYVQLSTKVVTDVNLRNVKKLDLVTVYLERTPTEVGLPLGGWELWLRDGAAGKRDCVLFKNWVNHRGRVVSENGSGAPGEEGEVRRAMSDDDRLDMEYRYWSYMEAHPAHETLHPSAHAEAVDVLTWSYTDCLLPSPRPILPPFEQEECQELMNLLRSVSASSTESATQAIVHTRAVARILMRLAQWRQHHFRPNKPLPQDLIKPSRRVQRKVRRTMCDFLISVLCLGLPYVFAERARHRRVDEESGLRSATPMIMIGACACLLAAVLLSASITFLTLPGVDDVARVSGLVTIVCSTASMVSWLISMFRYNSSENAERPSRYVIGEGMVSSSRRSVVMSLPLVFLAYSIIAFITGLTIYSFRGFTIHNPRDIIRHFGAYTKWTVVGTVGGFATVLLLATCVAH